MDDATIEPGSPVIASDGRLGVIERVITGADPVALDALVVRAEGSGARYSVPASLIDAVGVEGGQHAVYLSATLSALERYRISDADGPPRADEPPRVMTHVSAPPTGLAERLQAAFDSWLHGERDGQQQGDERTEDTEPALRIPVVEEQLVPHTEQVQIGTVRVHKSVESTEETIVVPVAHEEPEVDYLPAAEYDPKAPYQPGETYIPLLGEQIVIQKRQVIVGYVRVRKHTVTQDQPITETVRRERVTVTRETAPDA